MPKIPICRTLEEAVEIISGGEERILEMHSHALIGDKGAAAIGEAIKESKVVEILILPGQEIGPEGAAAIGQSLNKNTWLKELHLPNNKLGYEGVKRLCEELAQPWTRGGNRPGNKSLQILGLKNNGIEPHCGDCVICRESPLFPKALLELSALRVIDLNLNNLTDLPLAFCTMPNLVGLDVRGNPCQNIPLDVFKTAREGHQTGWPVLKKFLQSEHEKGNDRQGP